MAALIALWRYTEVYVVVRIAHFSSSSWWLDLNWPRGEQNKHNINVSVLIFISYLNSILYHILLLSSPLFFIVSLYSLLWWLLCLQVKQFSCICARHLHSKRKTQWLCHESVSPEWCAVWFRIRYFKSKLLTWQTQSYVLLYILSLQVVGSSIAGHWIMELSEILFGSSLDVSHLKRNEKINTFKKIGMGF